MSYLNYESFPGQQGSDEARRAWRGERAASTASRMRWHNNREIHPVHTKAETLVPPALLGREVAFVRQASALVHRMKHSAGLNHLLRALSPASRTRHWCRSLGRRTRLCCTTRQRLPATRAIHSVYIRPSRNTTRRAYPSIISRFLVIVEREKLW